MRKPLIRRAFKMIMLILNIIIVLFYLLACSSAYLNPSTWWMISIIGLSFPYLAILLLLFVVFWFIAKPKIAWVSLLLLLVGIPQFVVFFSTKSISFFNTFKNNNSIRIISWNVQSFNGMMNNKTAKKLTRTEIENTINKYQPDIICMQEFNTSGINNESNNISLFKNNYPFHFFSADYKRRNGLYKSGCIIFSKLPIVASGRLPYANAESLIYVDVLKNADTIRVFTTHLQSFKFKKEDYNELDHLTEANDASIAASKNIIKKMKFALRNRSEQVTLIKNIIDTTRYPNILCGDFNDVPYSYTYFTLKKNRQDAFLQKHFGIGKTFIGLAYSLRIDYILPNNNFEIQQFDLIDENLSDHLMLVADVTLRNMQHNK